MSRFALFLLVTDFIFISLVCAEPATGQRNHTIVLDSVFISIEPRNLTVEQVFTEISSRTGFEFVYNRTGLSDKKFKLEAQHTSLKVLLNEISISTGLEFKRVRDNIVVKDTRRISPLPDLLNSDPFKSRLSYLTIQAVVRGKVVDENAAPLPGVSVIIKGGTLGTTTDSEGNYNLSLAGLGNPVLVFSFIGYATQEIAVNAQVILNVSLVPQHETLDEVVIVGYGKQEKKEITTAVSSVKAENFNKGNINNPAQLLQGKVAGLSIVAPQGNPNGSFDIRLRGLSTLGANAQPLIIIDGVIGVDLQSVDPNDVATIDVLKDGGAAAIYGTRGSSGVILITTKSGVKGKAIVEYNGYLTAENKDRALPVMDKGTYLANGGTDLGANTRWLDEITKTAVSHVHNMSLSGGNDLSTYRASLNYRDVEGVLTNSGFKQVNGRLNLTQHALQNRLTLTLNLASTSREAELGFDEAFRYAVIMPPTAPIKSSEPYYVKYGGYFQSEVSELFNPKAIVSQNINDQKISRLMYNVQADYDVTADLTASIRYARNSDDALSGSYISKNSYYGNGVNRNGLATKSMSNNKNDLFETLLNYSRSFQATNVSVLGGYSYQNLFTESMYMQGGNFLTDAFTYSNFSGSRDFIDGKGVASSAKENNRLIAFFGRVNVNYDNVYFLSASLRREGSTRFGTGNKWGNFPGISLGVDLSEIVTIPLVDQLKIRASYGVTGNLPDKSYLSQQLYAPSSGYFLYNEVWTQAYSPISNPNPDLRWETKSEVDFGVDFSLLSSRLTGSFDYYNRTTTDALIALEVPVPPNLFGSSILNAGELKNKGIELLLRYDVIKGPRFQWTPQLTFATYDTEIVSLSIGDLKYGIRDVGGLPAPLAGNPVRVEEGKPIGQMIGWIYEGIDENGQYKRRDIDGDGAIDTDDITLIGRGLPKGEIGLTNAFRHGNFDFNFVLRGVYGHDLVNLNRTIFEQISRISSYNLVNTEYFNPDYKGPAAYNSYYLEDASFLKLDNVTLGYNFKFSEKSIFSYARAYVSGQNLFYITKYTGVDPEPRYTYGGNVLVPGVEPLTSWVTTRSFTFGVNLSL